MKYIIRNTLVIAVLLFCLTGIARVEAQGIDNPLTIQQMDNFVVSSARSRAMGSVVNAIGNDATVLFSNPAALTRLNSIDLRLGASNTSRDYKQTQEWYPNRLYVELSLLFENRQDGIKDPGDNGIYLVRAPDSLLPNWNTTVKKLYPGYAAAAIPFSIGGIKIVGAAGYSELVDLNYYYQNNNALRDSLNRYIGQWRPEPIERLSTGNDTLAFQWFQHITQRQGSIYGITPSIAVGIGENFSCGISGTILTGSTDDREERNERGLLRVMSSATGSAWNIQSVDTVYGHTSKIGTSKFSGTKLNIGLMMQQKYYSVGLSIRPSFTVTRDWNRTVTLKKTGLDTVYRETGSDKVTYPLNYKVGIGIFPSERLTLGVDYELRSYSDATYQPDSTTQNPWLDSQIFRVGLEYKAAPWLSLRAGYSEDVQSFAEEGAGVLTDPVHGSVYSVGCGFQWKRIQLGIAYEYAYTKYLDVWESNVNYNTREANTITMELGYQF